MDNAARALLLAGGILIGVLIISLGAYYLTYFREAYSISMNTLNTTRSSTFNNNFTKFGSRVKGYEVWNIMSYVKEANNDSAVVASHVTSNGDIKEDDYEKKLFFMDALLREYNYTYEFGPNGMVNSVTITKW